MSTSSSENESTSSSENESTVSPEEDEMLDARLRKVSKALKNVAPPGSFFVSGEHMVFPQPVISVDGLGELVPPLVDSVMKELVAKCHLAPYGHGEKTLVDTQVRNTWELSTNQFQLTNPAWSSFVKDEILPSIRAPLGINKSVQVQAKLYKMLLYEAGGKFEKHQDSEKEDGMFGTLVVVLPGRFEGGELLVHDPSTARGAFSTSTSDKKSHVWDPAAMDPFAIKFAAFYGDCPHEVKSVTKGYRLCLTYNLVNVGESGSSPCYGTNHPLYVTLKDALCEFFTDERASQLKRQRVDEEGTQQACGFDITKPEPIARASAFELFLTEIKYEFEWCGPEGTSYDSEKEELGRDEELTKKLILLPSWTARGREDNVVIVAAKNSWADVTGDLASEVAPVGMFDSKFFEFDDQDEELYTGNEGSRLEKWYQSMALVLVPVAVALEAQLRKCPETVFKRWVSLAETKPSHARGLASGFGNAFLEKDWSLTSETGLQAVEAACKLGSLDVIRCLVTSVRVFEFLPKLREAVASFSAEAVASMSKAVSDEWEKGDYVFRGCRLSNRVNLVASLLDGVRDPATITTVLEAVPIDPREDEDVSTEEYARVLLLALRVSAHQARTLLYENDKRFFLYTAIPATRILAETCGSEDWDVVNPIASYVIEWLTVNEAGIKKFAYEATTVTCRECPYCDCNAVRSFLCSAADSKTLNVRQAKRLEELGLEGLIKTEPTTGTKPGAMLATKTYESKTVAKAQKELEALREAVAKHTQ